MKLFEVIEEKPSQRMLAQFDQMIRHGYQRGVPPFQVRRQQGKKTVSGGVAIGLPKIVFSVGQVGRNILDIMSAVDAACCTTALKNVCFRKFSRLKYMRLEK